MYDKLEILKKCYFEAVELNKSETAEFETHKQYFNGDQLPFDVKQILQERGQPEHWENIYVSIHLMCRLN